LRAAQQNEAKEKKKATKNSGGTFLASGLWNGSELTIDAMIGASIIERAAAYLWPSMCVLLASFSSTGASLRGT